MSRGLPRGRERIRNRATHVYQPLGTNTDITGIAVALFLAFAAMICASSPRYLELAPGSGWAVPFVVAAVILGVVGLAGLVYEVYLIRGFGRQNYDAWVSAFIALFFALLASAVHLVAVVALDLTGWIGVMAKLIVLAICFLFALALAATIDDFFIKPRLGKKTTKAQRANRNQLIGNLGAVILWLLTVISTTLTLLDRLFG